MKDLDKKQVFMIGCAVGILASLLIVCIVL